MSVGLKLLVSLIDSENGVQGYASLRLTPEYFAGDVERSLHDFVQTHIAEYGKLPSRTTCKEHGFKLLPPTPPEPPQYYADRCKDRFLHLQLKDVLKAVESDLNEDRPAVALDRLMATASLCQTFASRNRLVDFAAEAYGIVKNEYMMRALSDGEGGLSLGWPTLDRMTSGLQGGDLVAIVGRPGSGKTFLMLKGANTAWLSGKVPLFVSMEMKPLPVIQRVAAMLASVPITGLRRAEMSTTLQERWQTALHNYSTGAQPYWIVDGALTSTVSDIVMLARQLKPDVVFIDGAYLLRSENVRAARWEKLTDNAERIKGDIAEGLGIPTLISYQFNRQVRKGAKSDTVGLEDIAYTDAIGQLSSLVLGLLQEKSVETLTRRKVEVLKGRSGENGSFEINWMFDQGPKYMNFDEVEQETGDLKFV